MNDASAAVWDITSDNTTSDIQGLIDSIVADGDTLNFISDFYELNMLTIDKSLNIVSAVNSLITSVDPDTWDSEFLFHINADNVNISGFRIENFSIAIGNHLSHGSDRNVNNTHIFNNNISNNGAGIKIHGNNTIIENNTLIDNYNESLTVSEGIYSGYGITTFGDNVTVNNNYVEGSKYGIANYASNSKITNNNVTKSSKKATSGSGHAGIANTYNGTNSVVSGNRVYDNYNIGIRNDCENALIENNELDNNARYGIYNKNDNHGQNETGSHVVIKNNVVKNTKKFDGNIGGTGIYNSGYHATIDYNTVYNNEEDGIYINNTGNLTDIRDNIIYNNNRTGIRYEGDIGTITNNDVYNNSIGVHLFGTLIALNGNQILENDDSGLIIEFSNSYLNIFNNTLKKNGLAINIKGNNNTLGDITSGDRFNHISENGNGVLLNGTNNIVSHLNIYNNNGTGFILLLSNNTIETCNVINNKVGFNITENSSNNIINYNRIYNNSDIGMINQGANNNANLNWWGSNNITGQFTDLKGDLTLKNWFVIQLSANDYNTTVKGTSQTYDAYTKVLLKGTLILFGEYTQYNKMNLPPFLITYTDIDGSKSQVDIRNNDFLKTLSGEYNVSYTFSGESDNEFVDLTVIFKPINNTNPFNPGNNNNTNGSNNTPSPSPNKNSYYSNDSLGASASMKNTGVPIAILALIFTIVGLVARRKR